MKSFSCLFALAPVSANRAHWETWACRSNATEIRCCCCLRASSIRTKNWFQRHPPQPSLVQCTSQHILARNKGICSVYEDFMDIRERSGGNKVGRQAPALWPASSSRVWPSPLADIVVTPATEAREAWAVAQRLQGQINPG